MIFLFSSIFFQKIIFNNSTLIFKIDYLIKRAYLATIDKLKPTFHFFLCLNCQFLCIPFYVLMFLIKHMRIEFVIQISSLNDTKIVKIFNSCFKNAIIIVYSFVFLPLFSFFISTYGILF